VHFNGPLVRPHTDTDSVFVEVTVGCTHKGCTFCNFYGGFPFRVAPISQVEEDLKEASSLYPHAKRAWASGGNPFALSVARLEELAKLFKKYLPQANIGTYARITDLYRKSVADIRHLRSLGINDIVIGIESGDDEVLEHVKKGYTATDIVRECKKLEEAGMTYRVIYLGGLGGRGKGVQNAVNSAQLLNQIHPSFVFLTNVAVLPGTKLYEEMESGEFEEASERERIQELRTLIANLNITVTVDSTTSSSSVLFRADLPEDKEALIAELDKFIENFTPAQEAGLHERRSMMRSV
jgi:radical SAM superfamily enzyme YgiQ (UPF0313 family)